MRPRGFGVEIYLIAAAIGLIALAGAYGWGRIDGRTIERATWEKRDNDALRQANKDLDEAHRKLRAQEHQSAERVAQVSSEYQEELTHARETNRQRLADLERGTLRLRDPAASNQTCPDRLPGAPAGAGGRDGPAPGELSTAASRFLLELSSEADEVAKQLTACQSLLRVERKP